MEHAAQDMAALCLQACSQVATDRVSKSLERLVCLFKAELLEVADRACDDRASELDLVEEVSDLALEVHHRVGTDGQHLGT